MTKFLNAVSFSVALMFSGRVFHNLMVLGKKDVLCEFIREYGRVYEFSFRPWLFTELTGMVVNPCRLLNNVISFCAFLLYVRGSQFSFLNIDVMLCCLS